MDNLTIKNVDAFLDECKITYHDPKNYNFLLGIEYDTSNKKQTNQTNKVGFVYRIYNNDMTYVGSTAQSPSKRLKCHESTTKNKTNKARASKIIETGNYKHEILEIVMFNNRTELNKVEAKYVKLYNAINKYVPARTDAEYEQDNKEQRRAYQKQHADKIKTYQKQYHQQHIDKIKTYRQQYHQQHIDKIKTYRQQYKQECSEKIKAYYKQYQQQHKEKLQEYRQQYQQQHKEKLQEYRQQYYKQYYANKKLILKK